MGNLYFKLLENLSDDELHDSLDKMYGRDISPTKDLKKVAILKIRAELASWVDSLYFEALNMSRSKDPNDDLPSYEELGEMTEIAKLLCVEQEISGDIEYIRSCIVRITDHWNKHYKDEHLSKHGLKEKE